MRTSAALLALLLATAAQAVDTAYSPPVGGMTIVIPAGQTRSVALPVLHESTASGAILGRITGVGSNYLEDSTANWVAGELSSAANPYYLRIKTGAAAGRVLMVSTSANTATRVNLNNDGIDLTTAGIVTGANGDIYELIMADTLSDLFGGRLQGGVNAASADNVQTWSGAAWLTFYYNTTRNRWERDVDTGASPTRDNFVLRPDRGVMVQRRAVTELRMYVMGRVPEVAPRFINTRPGVTFLSAGVPVDLTLGSLSLQTQAPGWRAGTNYSTALADADLVQVWSGAAWLIFYYDSTNGRWQRAAESAQTNRNTFAVPAGRPVMIRRLDPGSTLVSLPFPYTISQ
jgi:uncharacterized protein (TIGR02597 family)